MREKDEENDIINLGFEYHEEKRSLPSQDSKESEKNQ